MKPYVNCKIEAFGNALRKFNKPYEALINNLKLILSFENKTLSLKTECVEDYKEFFLKNGLVFDTYPKTQNIIEILKNNEDSAVIIKIDSFYQPYSKKYYNKIHKKHNIYIKNVDLENKIVNVIEEEYSDSENYVEMKFNFKQIEGMYYGYLKNFFDTNDDLGDTILIINSINDN